MSRYPFFQALGLLLLGLGTFQLLVSVVAFLFWLIAGAWQPYTFLIAAITFITAWPIGYLIWRYRWPR
jgi:hypothetical protein